VPPRALRNR